MSIESRTQRRMDKNEFKNYTPTSPEDAKYYEALKKVKRIKGFYTHAMVYVVINIMIVIINVQNMEVGESYFRMQNMTTLLFWGIGLLAHGLSVFLPGMILGNNWEERKIKELMEKDKNNKWE
ncbi:2TM domain-containing protein [Flavobacterium sp.]|uniref:2TM domain-containing protein n=1 Tax=Flavobacterium sp. TaxID=239 RepID=UPI00262D4C7F|nr:2TM domain-containing protein [Flavobacterium sp.]MDD2985855.1 2TM domain-containing protein [Flavobacterium sp.]